MGVTEAWSELESQRDRLAATATADLFARDPGRFAHCTLEAAGVLLDHSRQRVDDGVLQSLHGLAESAGVATSIQKLFRGEQVNVTEHRAALHTALRQPAGAGIGGAAIERQVLAERARMLHLAEQVRSGRLKSASGLAFKDVVNIGIGGSDLGPLMAVRALKPWSVGAPRIHGVGNIDGTALGDLLTELDPRTTLFVVVSKTFTTEETLSNAEQARQWLRERAGAEAVARAARLLAPHQGLNELSARLAALSAETSDVASELRHAAESAEENPERLAQVRERRNLLRDLCRKYGDSLGEVIAYGRTAAARLAEMEGYEERVAALSAERASALADLAREQLVVGDARRAAATGLAAAVADVLRGLALPHASLVVSVGDRESDPAGEAVTFLFSANPGSDPLPLAKVASGGELARTMLALRLVLSDEQGTMVFDEVDAGIGGSAAVAVASALSELGTRHQVLAVTHLPQVAASAHTQVSVEKKVRAGSTVATVRVLGADERVGEIARMLSGGVADDSATAHARDLMEQLSRRGKSAGRPKGKPRR